ncbi:MAG TPA: ATP-binding protein [Frateuria sp.]|uniref:PAS domain-containing hybrid sensor histidine kinase/response regulator n=1 Tax=Frateuria sp. TaxID=2211372 RepID=UPI002DECA40B|nr:ATP-binding protein [Frateuria sp.]
MPSSDAVTTASPACAGDAELHDLFEHAPCGYLVAGPEGRIDRVNHTLADWLGVEPGRLAGRRFPELLSIAGKIYYETHFAPLLRMQGAFDEVALDLRSADGTVMPVLVNARERRDTDGRTLAIRITVMRARDRRRYEQELLEARRRADVATAEMRELAGTLETRVAEELAQRQEVENRLRQAQKMEAIGQLTGGVAHDFNNLLTVILGGLETIERQLASPAKDARARMERAVTMARHGAQRAATLTSRLLAFARRQPLQPRSTDASRLITGLADLLQRTLGATIALETVAGGGLWSAMADAGELENALVNLAVNARDAMPEGGRLTIETSNACLDEDYVASVPEPLSAGHYVLIAVSDTGHGMDQTVLQKAFEPFFTTKDVGKGTGLGLSQVYGFARQSGGHVRIYSEFGQGTTVKLYLPRCLDARSADPADPDLENPAPRGSETVLLVEDHADLLTYSATVLLELGYRVLAAPDAATGLALLQREPEVDLLFTDMVLPGGLDGRQLAEEARQRRPGLKVLYTSGYARNAILRDGRLDANVDLLPKPFTGQALARRIRAALDR